MSKTSGIKEAYDLIESFIQQSAANDNYPRKLVEAAKDWISQNRAFLAGPSKVEIGGKYWTEDGNSVVIWSIHSDNGCWCSDLRYHCSSTLRDRE